MNNFKQMITKFKNMVCVWDKLAFWIFGNNRMLVLNLVKVSNTLLFLINHPILSFNHLRSCVKLGNTIMYKYNKSRCSCLRNTNSPDNT
jgi:hypothetical protein